MPDEPRPLVSAVVPTCDRADTLRVCLRSILAQSVDLEVVLVDDGHTDAARLVCAELADPRLRLVPSNGAGSAAAARNIGLREARGEWIAFCDDDDLWAPDKLAVVLSHLHEEEGRWACSASVVVDADLELIGHEVIVPASLDRIRAGNVVPAGGSNVVAHRTLIDEIGRFDEALIDAEDWEFNIRLADAAPATIVARPLVAYRRWTASKSNNPERMERAAEAIRAKLGSAPFDRRADYGRGRYVANMRFHNHGRVAGARAYLKLAVRYRKPADAVRTLGVIAAPNAMMRLERRRGRARIPPEWASAADAWIAPYRAASTPQVG